MLPRSRGWPGPSNQPLCRARAPTSDRDRSSYEASFKQVECMRITYEPLMYKVGARLGLRVRGFNGVARCRPGAA